MSKFINVTRKTIMHARDKRIGEHDKDICLRTEDLCYDKRYACINVRRIFVSSNEEIKETVHASLEGVCVCIDYITKEGEDITDEMFKTATDFIDSIDAIKETSDSYFTLIRSMNKCKDGLLDLVSLSNMYVSIYKHVDDKRNTTTWILPRTALDMTRKFLHEKDVDVNYLIYGYSLEETLW